MGFLRLLAIIWTAALAFAAVGIATGLITIYFNI